MDSIPPYNVLKSASVGTSIQLAADTLMTLIESERADAANASLFRHKQLEQHFTSFRQSTMALHAAEQAKIHEAERELIDTQALLAQYQQYVANHHTANTRGLGQGQIGPVYNAYEQAHQDETRRVVGQGKGTSAQKRLDDLQAVLRDFGIVFSAEDNSLRFEAGWPSVLAQLQATDCDIMSAGRLHETLGHLTQRLQQDREHITQLEQRVLASDEERKRLIDNYELEIECLKLEISMMHNAAAATQTPEPTNVAAKLSQPTTPSTVICDTLAGERRQPANWQCPSDIRLHKSRKSKSPKTTTTAMPPFIDLRSIQDRFPRPPKPDKTSVICRETLRPCESGFFLQLLNEAAVSGRSRPYVDSGMDL